MATVPISYISMEVTTIYSGPKGETKRVIETAAMIDKMINTIMESDPEARRAGEPEVYSRVTTAMFANPRVLTDVLKLAYDDPTIMGWQTGGGNVTKEMDLGSLIGKRIQEEKVYRGQSTYTEGTVVAERPVDYEGYQSAEFTVMKDDRNRFKILGHFGIWKIRVGDDWLSPHEYAKRVESERAAAKVAERIFGSVDADKHRRRKPVRVIRHRRRRRW